MNTQPTIKLLSKIRYKKSWPLSVLLRWKGIISFLVLGYYMAASPITLLGQNEALFRHMPLEGEFNFSNEQAYEISKAANRHRLLEMLGAVDQILPNAKMELQSTMKVPALVAENKYFEVFPVRWQVFDGVYGEGLLL